MNDKSDNTTSYAWNFQNFTCVITILVKLDIYFLGLPWEIFLGVTTDDLLHRQPLKKKRMQYSLNYSGTRVCPLKIKITQYLVDSVLRSSWRVRQHWRYHGNRVLTVMFFLDLHFGCVRFCFYFYLLDDYINLNSAEIW